jgi:hypothetical protein
MIKALYNISSILLIDFNYIFVWLIKIKHMKKICLFIGIIILSINTFAQWVEQQVAISQTGYYTGYFKDVEVVDANTVWATIEYLNLQNVKVYNKHFAKTTDGGTTWKIDSINVTPSSLCISNIWHIPSNSTTFFIRVSCINFLAHQWYEECRAEK